MERKGKGKEVRKEERKEDEDKRNKGAPEIEGECGVRGDVVKAAKENHTWTHGQYGSCMDRSRKASRPKYIKKCLHGLVFVWLFVS